MSPHIFQQRLRVKKKGFDEAWGVATQLLHQNLTMDPMLQWEKHNHFRGKLSLRRATRVLFSRKVNGFSLWIWKMYFRRTIKHLKYIHHSKYKNAINKVTTVLKLMVCFLREHERELILERAIGSYRKVTSTSPTAASLGTCLSHSLQSDQEASLCSRVVCS